MGAWKNIESPKLMLPLELREITPEGEADRVFEVQELRMGAVFKVTLSAAARQEARLGARGLTDAEAERAACLAVEEALLVPPDKEPGTTYEVAVTPQDLQDA